MLINSPILKTEALKASLNKDDLIASTGWLDDFVSHHKIKMANLPCESAEVSKEATEQ